MAINRVQGGTNQNWTGDDLSSLSVTLSAVGSGNLICGGGSCSPDVTDLQVLDGSGNPCTISRAYDSTNNQTAFVFYRANVTNAPTTFTLSRTGAGVFHYVTLTVDEFSGVATSSPLTGTPSTNVQNSPGTGTDAITSGNTTPAIDGCLIYGYTQNDSGSTLAAAGTGYTSATSNATSASRSEYKVQTTAAATAATFTVAANESHITGVMAFTPATSGVTADFTTTLGSIGLSADASVGSVGVSGDATITIGAFTLSATASVSMSADASITLGSFSIDSTASAGWTVPVSWTDIAGEDGYRIKWGTASGVYTLSADVPANATAYDIGGLQAGTTYYSRVYGLAAGVEGTPSDEIVFVVGQPIADASITIDPFVLSSTASVTGGVIADAAIPLGSFSLASIGTVQSSVAADAQITLSDFQLSSIGVVSQSSSITADSTILLDNFVLSADASVVAPVTADVAISIENFLLSADAIVIPSSAAPLIPRVRIRRATSIGSLSSDVNICNMALSHLGDEAAVSSIDPPDGSAQAGLCARYYPVARDSLLDMFPWGFCSARTALTAFSDAPAFGWQFAYAFPNGAITINAVMSSSAPSDDMVEEFVTEALPDGTPVIYTNVENAVCRYNMAVSDVTKFSQAFAMALSWLLASYLAGPIIKGDSGRKAAKECMDEFRYWYGRATIVDAQQNRRRPIHSPDWISGREGGGYDSNPWGR